MMHYHTHRPVGSMLIACGAFVMQREATRDPELVTCAACVEVLAGDVERSVVPITCGVCFGVAWPGPVCMRCLEATAK